RARRWREASVRRCWPLRTPLWHGVYLAGPQARGQAGDCAVRRRSEVDDAGRAAHRAAAGALGDEEGGVRAAVRAPRANLGGVARVGGVGREPAGPSGEAETAEGRPRDVEAGAGNVWPSMLQAARVTRAAGAVTR